MAKPSKLRAALDNQRGRNFKLEKQRKLEKAAEKRKQAREADKLDEDDEDDEDEEASEIRGGIKTNGGSKEESKAEDNEEGWEDEDEDDEDEDEDDQPTYDLSRLADSDSSSESEIEQPEGDDEAEDIPLSDIESLASDDKGDIVPHQRLTINNTAALLKSLKSFALPVSRMTFSEHQAVTSNEPIEIADIEDDLQRELAFYEQSLSAVKEARDQLKKEDVPFTRPNDYFAEMVKSDEHMGRVRQKLVDAAANKRASQDAKRQRELKKFGKQVQVAKLQERDRQKRETLEKINLLKRKRQSGADVPTTGEDLFDVGLEDAAVTQAKDKAARRSSSARNPNFKRQKKDSKFGFGGKTRFSKSGDAKSSADMSGFSTRKMKAGASGAKKRPGKSRRAKKA